MKFIQNPDICLKYPNQFTGLIKVQNLADRAILPPNTNRLKERIREASIAQSIARACEHWRGLFSKMGAKPKYRSSLEALHTYFQSNGDLFSVNEIVDFYNSYSMFVASPMGAYDLTRFAGDLQLAEVGKGRTFLPLGNPKNAELTKDCEVAYFDIEKVVCRYWNLKDCDQTKITAQTQNVLFIFDLVSADPEGAAKQFSDISQDFSKTFGDQAIACGITGRGLGCEVQI